MNITERVKTFEDACEVLGRSKKLPFFPAWLVMSCKRRLFFVLHPIVGSRLCFKSSELATYAGEQFEHLYNEYFSA